MELRTVSYEGFSTRERRNSPVVVPPAILAEVNRKNAELRAARGSATDAERRQRLAAASARIATQDRTLAGLGTPTDNDRKRHAEEVAARIYNDEVAEFMKPKNFG